MLTVIIPVFNRQRLLRRALQSVAQQKVQPQAVLVVDDASTEDIRSVCEEYQCQYLLNQGAGVSAARNTGIRAADTEWVAFLDSDDEWVPEKIQGQQEFLKANPQVSFIHSNETWWRHGQVVPQRAKHRRYGGRVFEHCVDLCMISPSTVMAKKELLHHVGLFDESFPVCEDFDLWLRVSAEFSVGLVEESLTIKHGGHEDQLSLMYHSMDLWRVRALAKHLENPLLNVHELEVLKKSLRRKAEILFAGYKKYQNLVGQLEVEKFLNL